MPDRQITGIDIGTSKIATVIAKLSGGEKEPRIMGFSSVPSKGVKKGLIVDINQVEDVVEESVEKAERMSGSKIDSAYISVGGPHINSINSHGVVAISQPEVEITAEDINRAIDAARAISLSSNREVIEVIPREYIVDGQEGIKNPQGMTGIRLEVNTHIITASLTNLRNMERVLTDLGIDVQSYVFSGLASSLSSLTETEKELGVVLVDIGGGKTDICIFVDGALSYSSSIPIGARHITNDIAVGLRVSLESAEKIKLFLHEKVGKKKDSFKQDEIDVSRLNLPEGLTVISYKTVVDGIIKPRLEEMFEMVLEEIEKSEFVSEIPSGLVISGGGASTINCLAAAKKVVGLPARIGRPEGLVGLADEVLYPPYTAVAGLLIYGQLSSTAKERVNLKDFSRIFRDFSFKVSIKRVVDLFKSFIP